jgi:hypothetical protein
MLFLSFCLAGAGKNKNMFKEERKTSRKLLFLCSLTLVLGFFIPGIFNAFAQSPDGFSDVSRTHPGYTAITYLSQKGVVSGYADNTFRPDHSINRAEVLKIILNGSGIKADEVFVQHFSDVSEEDWFAPYVLKAVSLGFVEGDDTDSVFAPEREVNMAEFLKMLLLANNIDVSVFENTPIVPNVSSDAWYANYVNYAAALGIIPKDAEGNVDAAQIMTRGQVADTMYLLSIILNGNDTQFLLTRAKAEMAQIEVYIAANMVTYAKNASALAVDITQQAYKNMSTDHVVLGAAKIARAYDWLVDSFVFGIQGKKAEAAQKANEAIDKATEAWEANNDTQPIARHIKERAREILTQVGGTEQ